MTRGLPGCVKDVELNASEAQLHVEARLRRRRRFQPSLEERREFALTSLLIVEAIERDECAIVVRIDLQDPLVVARGLRGPR